MNREIKFRGKIVENGEWVYGCYFYGYQNYSYMETKEKKHYIEWYDEQNHYHVDEVIPSTVGQYTGLKDKNGKEIWEGDRVKANCSYFYDLPTEETPYQRIRSTEVVEYKDGHLNCKIDTFTIKNYNMVVIGNIHDKEEV